MQQNAEQIRGRIISFIRDNGPSLPVQISKETGLSILFASAFLSELFGDKVIKISNLRVGSSPLYFIPGQESQLERFSQYIKGKEKEAFLILQEKKILRDSELHPAIRVALKEIKDFAVPFEKNNETFWRYFLVEEPNEIVEVKENKGKEISRTEIFSSGEGGRELVSEIRSKPEKIESEKEVIKKDETENETSEEISKKETTAVSTNSKGKTGKKNRLGSSSKTEKKEDNNFFNKIKEFLSKKEIEIVDIIDFKNNQAVLKIKKDNREEFLFVFNKKKISEKEILESHKKASEEEMPYSILSLGETTKKLNDLISAIKDLSKIEKIE